jgi:hypothetical protein
MRSNIRFLRLITILPLLAAWFATSAATITWSGADVGVSTNWSDPLNWIGDVAAGVGDAALFVTNNAMPPAAGAAFADNVVSSSLVVSSLLFEETNGFHNTLIDPGVTLTVQNSNVAVVLISGSASDVGPATSIYNTISGLDATLTVNDTNSGSWLYVEQGSGISGTTGEGSHMATLDLSGLDTFNLTIGRVLVGVQGQNVGVTAQPQVPDYFFPQGTLVLAATNFIDAAELGAVPGPSDGGNGGGQGGTGSLSGPAILIGDGSDNEDTALPQAIMQLGQSNVIYADSITVGREKSSGTLNFNGAFSSPALYLRGASSNRVSFLRIADNSSFATSSSEACSGTVDLSGGTSDVMIDNLVIAEGQTGNGNSGNIGSFTMGAGTLNVNTVELGYQNSATAGTGSAGTLIVNSGNLIVNNQIILGHWTGGSIPTGTLRLTGSMVTVSNGIADQSGNSSSIMTVSGCTLVCPFIGGPSAPVGALTLGDTTLNIACSAQAAPVAAANLTTDSSVHNVINVTSISSLAAFSGTVNLIQSGNIIGGNGASDFVLGTLPTGFMGNLQVSGSTVSLVLTQSPYSVFDWTGADIAAHQDTNWSDGLNWSTGVAPGPTDPALFYNTGAVGASALSTPGGGPGAIVLANINNIVDSSFSVIDLAYANTNGTYNNTFITDDATLSVTVAGMTVGSPTTDFGNTTGGVTITGPKGTLGVTNSSSEIYVGLGDKSQSSTAAATLDMSSLGEFNAAVANFLVGVGGYNSGAFGVLQPVGTVYLAKTNIITASATTSGAADSSTVAIDIGDAGDAEAAAGYDNALGSSVYLGQTNALFADYITVGRQWGSGGLYFNPAFTNSTVYIRGASANAVNTWNIGDAVQSALPVAAGSGTNDFTGGTVDAVVTTLQIGKASPASPNTSAVAAGALTFGAGSITAGTVNVSYNPVNINGEVYDYAVGTLNVNGTAALTVSGTLNLALTLGPPQGGQPEATLNINGGSVSAAQIVPGGNGGASFININGGSLTVSNSVGSGAAPLTSLNLTNALINLGASVAFPAINAGSVAVDGTNTVTIASLPPTESYPLVFTLIQSSALVVGGSGFHFQAVFPVATPPYSGSISESADGTAVILTVTGGPNSTRGKVVWNGPNGADMNWSNAANWELPGVPGVNDLPFFDNIGSVGPGASAVDNIVDSSLTVAGLSYAETNSYHNTLINPGVTLAIFNTNAGFPLLAGTQTAAGATAFDSNTISGAGATLVVNNTNVGSALAVIQCGNTAATALATLDLSGLDTFRATVGRLLIGIQGFTNTTGQPPLVDFQYAAGTLILAKTNLINLTQLGNIQGPVDAANGNGSGSTSIAGPALLLSDDFNNSAPSILLLGQTNAIFADTVTIGREKPTATLEFNPNFTGSALRMRGASSNRVSAFYVADQSHLSTSTTSGSGCTADLSGGTSDIMADLFVVAKGESGSGANTVNGTFILGAGTLNANNAYVGIGPSNTAGSTVTGTLTINTSGNVVVNNQLVVGATNITGGSVTRAKGIVNIGGTVSANAILSGGGTSTINLTNGTISLTSITGSIGTTALPISSLTLSNATLNLAVGGAATPVVTSALTATGATNVINVTDLPLIGSVPDTLTLIQSTAAISFTNIGLGTLPLGYAGTIQLSGGGNAVQLVVTGAPFPSMGTTISSVALQLGTSVVITGSHGTTNGVYYVLTTTNLSLPANAWTPVATNTFDGSGNFSATVSYSTNDAQRFYVVKSQ